MFTKRRAYFGTRKTIPYSNEPFTGLRSDPNKSNPSLFHIRNPFQFITNSTPRLLSLFLQCLPNKFYKHFISMRAACPESLILLQLITQQFVRAVNCEAPHYSLFSAFLLLHSTWVQILSIIFRLCSSRTVTE